MKILVIPNWYKTTFEPWKGEFFFQQANALATSYGHDVTILYCELYRTKFVSSDSSRNGSFFVEQVNPECNGLYDFCDVNVANGKLEVGFSTYKEGNVNVVKYVSPRTNIKVFDDELNFGVYQALFRYYIDKFGEPDIIHYQSMKNSARLCLWIDKEFGYPAVLTEHFTGFALNFFSDSEIQLISKAVSVLERCFAVSSQFADSLTNTLHTKFEVLPNTVDVDFFSNCISEEELKELSARLGIKSDNEFTLLNVAGFNKRKNQENLILGFNDFCKDNKIKGTLIIAGGGELEGTLKSLADSVNSSEFSYSKVIVLGTLDQAQVRQLMHLCDLFILPSEFETFGVVLIESLATATPIITTKHYGTSDIMGEPYDEAIGVVIDGFTHNNIKNAIDVAFSKLKNNKFDKNKMIETAMRFSFGNVIERLNSHFKNIVNHS